MKFIGFLKSKVFLKQLIAVILLIITLFFLLKWWLGATTNHGQKIQVPDLKRLSLAETEKKLSDLNLQYVVIDSSRYIPEFPKKSILSQTPEAGDFVKENRKIYVTVNLSKYKSETIPNINGSTKRQATTQLLALGFNVGSNPTYIPDLGKNVVRGLKHNGKELQPGDKLPKKSVIEFILGDGSRGE